MNDGPNNLVFVPGKPFQPSLIFKIKARAYPNGMPFRYSPLGRYTMLVRPARDNQNHSSLFCPWGKKFCLLMPWLSTLWRVTQLCLPFISLNSFTWLRKVAQTHISKLDHFISTKEYIYFVLAKFFKFHFFPHLEQLALAWYFFQLYAKFVVA